MALINRDKPAVTNRPGSENATPPNTGEATESVTPVASDTGDAKTTSAEAKPEITLSLDDINGGGFMLAPELASVAAPVRARSDKQKAMDSKVKELHDKWLKASKPTVWDKMVSARVVATFFSPPELSAEYKKLVRTAVAFHDLRVKWGTPFTMTEKLRNTWKERFGIPIPEHYVGREVISYAVMDKRPRGTSEGKSASEVVAEKK
jgi:hypothetical protein